MEIHSILFCYFLICHSERIHWSRLYRYWNSRVQCAYALVFPEATFTSGLKVNGAMTENAGSKMENPVCLMRITQTMQYAVSQCAGQIGANEGVSAEIGFRKHWHLWWWAAAAETHSNVGRLAEIVFRWAARKSNAVSGNWFLGSGSHMIHPKGGRKLMFQVQRKFKARFSL